MISRGPFLPLQFYDSVMDLQRLHVGAISVSDERCSAPFWGASATEEVLTMLTSVAAGRNLERAACRSWLHIAVAALSCCLAASDISTSYFAAVKQEEQDNLDDFIT